jgi:nucleotide-binding universal stress UspA family protein
MQSILVPTDFSPNAYNAASYAIALAADINATEIILYNAYQPYVSEDPELGVPLQTDMEEFKQISADGLERMKNILLKEASPSVQLKFESEYNIIAPGIIDACKNFNADLIVMGISSVENKLQEAIIGSTAIDVSKQSEIPVIIVPAETKYSKLKKILLAVDLKKSADSTPVAEIKKLLDATKAQLDILHVEANAESEVNLDTEKKIIDALFSSYNPQYHFLQGKVFTDAINQFALDNNSDLIIVIPKKHGLFEGIFKRSHTKALAFHSHIPIMTIHE